MVDGPIFIFVICFKDSLEFEYSQVDYQFLNVHPLSSGRFSYICKGDIGSTFTDFCKIDLSTIHMLIPRIVKAD